MPIQVEQEVFPNPLVKAVYFQIRYPNLFFIEDKIGEIQLEVMAQFPESSLHVTQAIPIAKRVKIGDPPEAEQQDSIERAWVFNSSNGVTLEVKRDALTLVSTRHKSYRSGSESRFRDTIDFVLRAFRTIIQLPAVSRVGLRYVDACPIPDTSTATYCQWINTTLPLDRFSLESAPEQSSRVELVAADHLLRFAEVARRTPAGTTEFVLDMDASCVAIQMSQVLPTVDRLHGAIRAQFEQSVNEPVLHFMRSTEVAR